MPPRPDSDVERALDAYRRSSDAEAPVRQKMLRDLTFASGEQWDPAVKTDRLQDGKPAEVFDHLSGPVRQVINQIRSARPAIQVIAVGDGADVEKAQDLQGILRRIENNSDAEVAYVWAAEHQVKMGRGFWRVVTDYTSPTGVELESMSPTDFEQDIYIKRIKNQFSVYFDPGSQAVDGSDALDVVLVEDLTKEQYRARFGKGTAYGSDLDTLSLEEMAGVGDNPPHWLTETSIRVAEHFSTHYEPIDILLLGDGTVIEAPKTKAQRKTLDIRGMRTVKRPRIKWALVNACETLDRRDWPGQYIPIVPVYGEEWVIDGKTDWRGIVRMGIGPQKMINYERNTMIETVALAPRSPWLVDAASIAQYKQIWDTANRRNWAYLPYDGLNKMGQTAPPPQRMFGEPPIQAMVQLGQLCENDLRAATGFFDVQSEEQKPEQSGKAIVARQKQGEVGNSHYLSNLGRSIKHTARICMDLMPHIYDTPRVYRILDQQDQPKTIAVGPQAQMTPQHQETADSLFDPRVGRYDVTIGVGREYESVRQENVDTVMALCQADPQLIPRIGYLAFEQMDSPVASKIADALRPPTPEDVPPQLAAHLQQMQAQMQQLQQEADKNRTTLQATQIKEQGQNQRAQAQQQSDLTKAELQAATTLGVAQAKADAENFRSFTDSVESKVSAALDLHAQRFQQAHEAQQAQLDRTHELVQALVQHQHALQQGQQAAALAPQPMEGQA